MNKKVENEDNDDVENEEPAELSLEDELMAAYEAQDEDDENDVSDKPNAEGDTAKPDEAASADADADSGVKSSDKDAESASDDGGDNKAPINLNPELREDWKNLPEKWQKHFTSREAEVNTMLEDGKNDRLLGKNFTNLVQPYIPLMQAEGAKSPLHAVEELFKTVNTLRIGSPQEKALKMSQLIQAYGVDISQLDEALVAQSGGQAPAKGGNIDPGMMSLIDERLQPVQQLMQKMEANAQAAQRANNEANQRTLTDFAAKNEFYNDVRHQMADFLDVAAQNGQKMTLEEAYERACAINPQISSVKAERSKQEALMNGKKNMAAKRTASGSLAPAADTPNTSGAGDPMRQAIEDAWEEHAS